LKIYLKDFILLNEAWIQKYFEIEQIDRILAENPYPIIENGGYVFTILKEESVVDLEIH